MPRPAHWLFAAALLIPLAGCGGSSDPAGPAAGGGAGQSADDDEGGGKAGECEALYGVTVCMSYDLTGDVTGKGRVPVSVTNGVEKSPESCEEWARGAEKENGERRLFMPSQGPSSTPEFVGLPGNIITDYTGPGTYQKKDLSGEGSPAGIVTGSGTYVLYTSASTGTATVNADGSGSFTFTGLSAGNGEPTVSGSVTWTCHNP